MTDKLDPTNTTKLLRHLEVLHRFSPEEELRIPLGDCGHPEGFGCGLGHVVGTMQQRHQAKHPSPALCVDVTSLAEDLTRWIYSRQGIQEYSRMRQQIPNISFDL
jgi:hypothetical protein